MKTRIDKTVFWFNLIPVVVSSDYIVSYNRDRNELKVTRKVITNLDFFNSFFLFFGEEYSEGDISFPLNETTDTAIERLGSYYV